MKLLLGRKYFPIYPILFLAGCSTFNKNAEDNLEYRKNASLTLLNDSKAVREHSLYKETDGVYLGKLVYGKNEEKKPMELNSLIYYNESTAMEVDVALQRIGLDYGLYIYMADDAKDFLGIEKVKNGSSSSSNSGAEAESGTARKSEALTSKVTEIAKSMTELAKRTAPPEEPLTNRDVIIKKNDYSNKIFLKADDITLGKWLDDFTIERGLFWKYGYIQNRPYVEITSTISESFQFDGSTNVAGDSSVTTGTATAWTELKTYVEKIKSSFGTVSASDSTGRFYVTDRPSVLNAIRSRIEHENELYSTDILYDLRVITYRQSENENYQLNWTSIYKDLSNSLGISTAGTAGSGFSATYTLTDPTSTFSGSNATVNALKTLLKGGREISSIGQVRNRSHFKSAPTVNSSIVSGTEVTTVETGTVVTEKTEVVSSGITFDVVGSVISGGRVSIDMSVIYSDEISRENRTGANGDFSLPTTYNVPLTPSFTLAPGETSIFATNSSNTSSSTSGVGDNLGILNFLLGGGSTVTKEETLTLVILSARVVGN